MTVITVMMPEADDHVQRVQPGHREVERVELLGRLRIQPVPLEVRAGDEVVLELVGVLDGLDRQERGAEDHRREQPEDLGLALLARSAPRAPRTPSSAS